MHYVKGVPHPIICTKLRAFLSHHGRIWSRGMEEGVRDVGPGDMIFIPAEEEHRLRASKTPLFLFRVPGAQPFRHDDSGWDAGRPSLGTRGRRSLGSKRKTSVRPRRNSCLLLSIRTSFTEESGDRRGDRGAEPGSVRRQRMWWRHCAGMKSGEKFKAEASDKHQLLY